MGNDKVDSVFRAVEGGGGDKRGDNGPPAVRGGSAKSSKRMRLTYRAILDCKENERKENWPWAPERKKGGV